MLINEKYKIIKKGINPPFNGINAEKWPKILISKILYIFFNVKMFIPKYRYCICLYMKNTKT